MTDTIPPFSLIIGGENGQIDNADVRVRWCITPEFVKQMDDDGVVDPHILLVTTTSTGHEMSRTLIPVGELMTYARFTKAGEAKIFAWLIDGKEGRKKIRQNFILKTKGGYKTELIEHDYKHEPVPNPEDKKELKGRSQYARDENGGLILTCQSRNDIDGVYAGTDATVTIPSGVFGREPHPSIKWYVNAWHSGHLDDECHFRKRLLIAIFLKPWVFLPVTLFLLSIKVGWASLITLGGYRQYVNWRYVRPWKYAFENIIDSYEFDWTKQNFWIYRYSLLKKEDPSGNGETRIFLSFTPFIPIIPIILYIIGYAIHVHPVDAVFPVIFMMSTIVGAFAFFDFVVGCAIYLERNHTGGLIEDKINKLLCWFKEENRFRNLLIGLSMLGLVIIGVLFTIVPLITLGVLGVILLINGTIFSYFYGLELLLRWIELKEEDNDPTYIREMLCPSDLTNLKAQYDSIPKNQRTIRLWFLDLKNKVCKPMQY